MKNWISETKGFLPANYPYFAFKIGQNISKWIMSVLSGNKYVFKAGTA